MLIPPPTDAQTRCAVLGSPIAHSRSPVLHRAAYQELGLGWTYDAVEVRESELAGFLAGLDDTWRGLSLTMPLKRAVMPLLDEMSEVAAVAGAANTVVLAGGQRIGDNTDVPGAVAALRERYSGAFDRAVVVGGGATAASALLALADLGCAQARLLVRSPERAGETLAAVARHPEAPSVEVSRLSEPLGGAEVDVVVSTVPAAAQVPALVTSLLRLSPAVALEVVYDPWPTPLMTACTAEGVTVVDGFDLLTHQAALQVRLMTGHPVGVETLRAGLAGTG